MKQTSSFYANRPKKAMILTAGGLCPGMNTVVRQLVTSLKKSNVTNIIGAKNGFDGLNNNTFIDHSAFNFSDKGCCLGMCRKSYNTNTLVKNILNQNVTDLYAIGDDGTMTAAHDIAEHISNSVNIIGIPKTIDNDICVIDHSFGFYTAIDETVKYIECAYIEAKNYNTLAVVETMGRDSGFLAAHASAASPYADLCIIPEQLKSFEYYFDIITKTMKDKGHCVVVLSEGCGEDYIASFKKCAISVHSNTKYISAQYAVRTVEPNAYDSIYCKELAKYAVDVANARFTDCVVGKVKGRYCTISLPYVANKRRKMNEYDPLFNLITH